MIRNGDRPSQSLRAKTRGLDSNLGLFSCHSNPRPETLGRSSWYRQTDIERITNNPHQRPSSTNSFHHPHAVQPGQTCTYKRRKKTGRHDMASHGLPYESPRGWFRAGSCKAQENLPIPLSFQKTRPVSNNQTNGALTKSNGSRGRTSTNPSQWGNWNASGTLWQ